MQVPGVVTGKPIALGGSVGRFEATAKGVFVTALEAVKHLGMPMEAARVAIQERATWAAWLPAFFREPEPKWSLSAIQKGVNTTPKASMSIKQWNARTRYSCFIEKEIGEAEAITNEELLRIDCDILVPCALESQITGENASNLRCRLIVEGANGPTTPEADDILHDRGIFVVPDILANAGGVTVSYSNGSQRPAGAPVERGRGCGAADRHYVTEFFGSPQHQSGQKCAHENCCTYSRNREGGGGGQIEGALPVIPFQAALKLFRSPPPPERLA